MRTIGIIPARMASTRFPGKVLADLNGKTILQWVWEKASGAKALDEVIIACDHADVLAAARGFGAKAVMTDPAHPSGTDRIAQAAREETCDIIVNIQGDEPLMDPRTIDALARLLKEDASVEMGTTIKPIVSEEEFLDPNVVKCVIDESGYALYFSRAPIPHRRDARGTLGKRYKHLGLYAYRKEFLLRYQTWPKGALENVEELEQLRVLEKGGRIKTVTAHHESIAIDTPLDLEKAKAWLRQQSN